MAGKTRAYKMIVMKTSQIYRWPAVPVTPSRQTDTLLHETGEVASMAPDDYIPLSPTANLSSRYGEGLLRPLREW